MRSPIVLLGLLICACALRSPAQQVHKFPDQGFRISAPANWTLIPPRPGENWILAHFMSDREYTHRDPNDANAGTTTHRPRIRVIGFQKRESRVDVKVVDETETRKSASITYPYFDYDDYMKRHHQGGGYYVSASEEIIVGGVPVKRQEVKVEKMAAVPRRLLACIYRLPDREIAVEADVLESQAAALSDEIYRSLKSLVVTGEAKKPESAPSRPDGPIVGDDLKDIARKRDERRRAWRERVLADVQKTLPKGWTARRTKNFLVVSHASSKYTDLLVWQANEVRDWLDQNLKDVGSGQVMRSVLRVCASGEEARAYQSGSGDSYVWDSGEVVCAEREGSILGDFSAIASALLDQYLADRNPALEGALPLWLQVGLDAHVSGGRISKKESGLVFPPPIGALRSCLKMASENRLMPVNQLLRTEPDASANDRKAWDQTGEFIAESELFVRYLLSGPGKSGRTKGLIQRAMSAAVAQLEAREAGAVKKAVESRPTRTPMTEAEEEEDFNLRRAEGREFAKKHREERLELLGELTATVFKDWKPEDWTRLDKSFESWVKNGLK